MTDDTSTGMKVLVTGAGTGIGRAIALAFAARGAKVALHYSHSSEGADSAVEQILSNGSEALAFAADFSLQGSHSRLASDAIEFLGGLDVLVNNAGITMNAAFGEVAEAEFDTLLNVNLRSPFFLTQEVLPHLRESEFPSVINISSIHAYGGVRCFSVYAATRGAVVSLTRQLAIELAPQRIRVNGIAPGAIEVENYYKAVPDFDADSFGKKIPVGFVGQPEDIAQTAIFLASPRARFITGQTLVVDGGTTAWFAFSEDFRQSSDSTWGKGYVPGR